MVSLSSGLGVIRLCFTTANSVGLEEKDPHITWGLLKQGQMFSEETNLPFFFYVFILFILHANASIGKNKVMKDVENIGSGGRTATNTGYLKSSYR